MDHRNISEQQQYLSIIGHCLTIQEQCTLKNSLVVLKREGHFNKGFSKDMTDERTSFYSVDKGISWKQLIPPEEWMVEYLESVRGFLHGDPSFQYKFDKPEVQEEVVVSEKPQAEEEVKIEEKEEEGEGEGEDDEASEEEEGEGEVQEGEKEGTKKREFLFISEEKRLSFVITKIDDGTSVVPRGSYILKLNGQVEPNLIFQGLNKIQATKLNNYYHLKKESEKKRKVVDSLRNKSVDFLVPVESDIPKMSWVLKYYQDKNIIVAKSLLWSGYVFFHKLNTNSFGSYYYGYGFKNSDLCFML